MRHQQRLTHGMLPARVIGRRVLVLKATTEHEIEDAFAVLARERVGALLVGADTFFLSQATLFVVLTPSSLVWSQISIGPAGTSPASP